MENLEIKNRKLSQSSVNLLNEILSKQQIEGVALDKDAKTVALSTDLVEELCQLVMDEFCETGLLPNDEPNQR